MKFSIITPSYNGLAHLETCLHSVLAQRQPGLEIEHIVVDGGSTDGSVECLQRHAGEIDVLIVEPDGGPAAAINKGLRRATGEVIGWLNADDAYHPHALARAAAALARHPARALIFGRCRIVDEESREIRRIITRFKEMWFPLSSRFLFQCLNYVSQPAVFFRREAMQRAGLLREDLKAAWDYEFFLRLWRQGGAVHVPGSPLADFRWHAQSISGLQFRLQFEEEWQAAVADAGRWSPQALIHWFVRWGIIGSYTAMAWHRENAK